MYQRLINFSKSHSFYLFGGRGTGKSTLLRSVFDPQNSYFLDLLSPQLADELTAYPDRLVPMLAPHVGKKKWIVLDEIQKVPKLLDLVHQMIEEKKFLFALTGSSARKLKRGNANLLAGRAFVFSLFPLTHLEIKEDFNLHKVLQYGSLPSVIQMQDDIDKKRYLKSYADSYLKEEILVEQIIRNLPPFRRFLEVSGSQSGDILNYSNIARDVLSDAKTISSYYTILEDTLLGFYLPAFHTSIRKQQRLAKKFYFFDIGVARTLANRIDTEVTAGTYEYGLLFENFVINEIFRLLTYQEKQFKLSYLRVNEDLEIDLIIERAGEPTILCEIRSTNKVDERHIKGLLTLGKDIPKSRKILISNDPTPKKFGEIEALDWKSAIREIVGQTWSFLRK